MNRKARVPQSRVTLATWIRSIHARRTLKWKINMLTRESENMGKRN